MIVYVVIRYDRHTDDRITAHATRELADVALEAFKSEYGPGTAWDDQEVMPQKRWGQWVRFACVDDGPNVRIERMEVEGA